MRRRGGIAGVLLLAAGLGAGCGQGPAPVPGGTAPESPRQRAQALAERGEWALAVTAYREALREAPEEVALRFALGVALSHLDRRQEAIAEMRWVVGAGKPEQPEVRLARDWLRQVGALPEPPSPGTETAAAQPEAAPPEGLGRVRGRTAWPGVSPATRPFSLQILLQGDDDFTRDKIIPARTRLGEPYTLDRVPPGSYRLMAQVGAIRLWDTRVTVQPGRETVLDLTQATSPVSPAEFPLPAGR